MRQIGEVLRLKSRGMNNREIARSTGLGKTTVYEYLARAEAAGLSWPLPAALDDVHGWTASSGSGRLIQAGRGRPGGDGGLRTKRSGWAAWAAERITARAAWTWPARP